MRGIKLVAIAAAAAAATCCRNDVVAFHTSPTAKAIAPSSINLNFETIARHRPFIFRPSSRLRSSPPKSSTSADTDASADAAASPSSDSTRRTYRHTLAVLTLPRTSADRIANEAILETAMSRTSRRLSVVLRCAASSPTSSFTSPSSSNGEMVRPSLSQLRAYVGEVYTSAWDITLGFDDAKHELSGELLDVIVYPQNLPNAAPERWIARRPDLDCVCSHDSITGWWSSAPSASTSSGRGANHAERDGEGYGGLDAHVEAVNADRKERGLGTVEALGVDPWPVGADVRDDEHVVFLDDSAEENVKRWRGGGSSGSGNSRDDGRRGDDRKENEAAVADASSLLGGPRVRDRSLYDSVCVGGTFDGMHYGHRKLLTLAASSVQPNTGKLLIGITRDEMLTSKAYAEFIPPLPERIAGVRDFVDNLAPGLKNRVRIVPIDDAYGPPGANPSALPKGVTNDFDALVLSHETLPTGKKLNEYREKELGLDPLTLLCTRRTEPHGMSSTALRRMRKGVRPEANMI